MKKTKIIPNTLWVIFIVSAISLSGCQQTPTHSEKSSGTADTIVSRTDAADTEHTVVSRSDTDDTDSTVVSAGETANRLPSPDTDTVSQNSTQEGEAMMQMIIHDTPVRVMWEDNDAVAALKERCRSTPLTISMSMYGGFEQVGAIGAALPREDTSITTTAGDIVLYAGDQLVVFYGSNSWSYTRLGHITDRTESEMADLLAHGDVSITLCWR